ncbi:uncharacterized protein SCHCODRAFT_02515753 [Schizophyllum commune H4-8]|nr:uncharacterized protein SCHCODRAFT_02515753 [Schizophyllum commune H4-8]KAI5886874.1 hypothetical protein SCHCODRAFT_02515753 [Schizophyllum commune H4-8]
MTPKAMNPRACASADVTPSPTGELTIFRRLYGIPLVAAALDKLHETLSTNVLTAKPYAVAQGISVVAYKCWQPVQRRLAPLIARVDDFANATFDLAETRFPYLFYATPEDIMDAAYTTRATFFDDARTTLDEGIKLPALHVAEGIDERLAPLLDYYEDHIEPLGHKCARSARANNTELHETQYQYQRALDLTKALLERIASLPCDQWQQTSFLLQRSVIQVQELSDAMLTQLHTLQQTISYLATSMQRSVAAAQKQLTITLVEAANALSATLADLQNVLTSEELTAGERIDRIASITTSYAREDEHDSYCEYNAGSYREDEFGSFCQAEPNSFCEECCEHGPGEYIEDDFGSYCEESAWPQETVVDLTDALVYDAGGYSGFLSFLRPRRGSTSIAELRLDDDSLCDLRLCITSRVQVSAHAVRSSHKLPWEPSNLVAQLTIRSSACERKHTAGPLRLSSSGKPLRHGRILRAWSLRMPQTPLPEAALAQASTSSQDCDRAAPPSWTLPPKGGEGGLGRCVASQVLRRRVRADRSPSASVDMPTHAGETRSIARDPVTQKFPCPCGAPKHARREADKIRILCNNCDPHPGPNEEKALEVGTDDEDANPGQVDPPQVPRSLRKRKRRAPRSPSPPSDTAPCSDRRAGKRRATVPHPHDSSDDEVIIVENPSSLNRGGPGTRGFAGATHISAYGGIEHATGSRPALRKPFEYSEDQGDLERQVKSLAALNLAARLEYIEVSRATVVHRRPSLTRYSVPRRAKSGLAAGRRAQQGADAPSTADERQQVMKVV